MNEVEQKVKIDPEGGSQSPESKKIPTESKRRRSRSKERDRPKRNKPIPNYDSDSEKIDEFPRYYGEPEKVNSDKYWNKYPRKEDIQVGARYYETVEKNREEGDIVEKNTKVEDKVVKEEGRKEDKVVKEEGRKEDRLERNRREDDKMQKNRRAEDRMEKNRREDDKVVRNKEGDEKKVQRQRKTFDILTSKTGGAYIPPAKLRMMQAEITDKKSTAYQRIAWEALKKSIHGCINKVNTSNIGIIAREILHENIVRGRGLLCKSIIQAQSASPTFTHVYSALVAVINSKFPNIGELLLRRLVLQFKRGFKQNNKITCITAASFIAHLVNQRVAHEILALEILTLLVESPTDDSVEVAISFLKECGQKLTEVSSKGISAIFEMLRNILHEGQLEKRIQYMIEVMFQIRKDGFKDHAAIIEDLDLIEEEDQFTHLITLEEVEPKAGEDMLNVFRFDDNYEENEGKYKTLTKELLGSDVSGSESGSEGSGEEEEEEEQNEENKDASVIIDSTETNLVTLRRTIYLTIQSSLDFEECAHKLMKMELKPGQEIELCHMFLDCCAEQRTYEKFYGLLSQRFCQINNVYVEPFQQIFKDTYYTTHRLDTNRLRNVSKFFAHLLFTDAISWQVLEIIKLNEEDTNSSSRIFIKILFQELSEYMGTQKLNARLKDPTLESYFAGLFPRDNPKNTRFSINFFTSIGLGGLTNSLREHLKMLPKLPATEAEDEEGSSSSSESSSSSSSDSSSSSSDSSDESEEEKPKKNKNKKQRQKEAPVEKKQKERNRREPKDDEERLEKDRTRRRKDENFDKQRSRQEDLREPPNRRREHTSYTKPRRSRSRSRENRYKDKERRPRTDRISRRS